jgi:hypothetical protein
MRGTLNFTFDKKSLNNFNAQCNAALSKVGNGSRKALVEACNYILDESMSQVPTDTLTLLHSAFWDIEGHWKTGWEAIIGYGGNGDPINPKTGKSASSYMVAVHEDITAHHPVGKAKFLEDPIRDYAAEKFPRTVFKYAQDSLADMSK